MLAAVIGVVVGAGHISSAGASSSFDNQCGIIDGLDGELRFVFRHHDVGGGNRLLCGGDVENIAEDDGLAGEQLEVRIHEFAECVGCPVVGITQLLYRLGPAGAEDGRSRDGGLIRSLDRSQANHEGDAGLRHDRSADAGSLLRDIYAVVH